MKKHSDLWSSVSVFLLETFWIFFCLRHLWKHWQSHYVTLCRRCSPLCHRLFTCMLNMYIKHVWTYVKHTDVNSVFMSWCQDRPIRGLLLLVSLLRSQVEKLWSSTVSTTNRTRTTRTGPGLSSQSAVLDTDQEAWPKALSYHVRGPVNQVYSEILLSRLCSRTRKTEDNSL